MGRKSEELEAPPDRDAYITLSARAGGRFGEADGKSTSQSQPEEPHVPGMGSP